jgi:putative flavoprotein involved in K+ transport
MASSCAAAPWRRPARRSGSPTAQLSPKAVIWATGFVLDHSFVQAPVFDKKGRVEHRRGVTAVPGLYFLGLPWQHTRGSALLGWVKDDAEYIASEIAGAATRISEPPTVRTAA